MMCVFCLVFVFAYATVITRPVDLLASIWLPNGLLLGLFVRIPRYATVRNLGAAFAGYISADILAGDDARSAFWLSVANVTGVAVGLLILRRCSMAERQLRHPLSMLWILGAVTVASAASALASIPVLAAVLDEPLRLSLGYWFASEMNNYIVILPVVLTCPPLMRWRIRSLRREHHQDAEVRRAAPAISLLLVLAISLVIGGPGAMVFAVPILIWWALTYSLFTTSIMTVGWSAFTLYAVTSGRMDLHLPIDYEQTLLSIRIGLAMVALAPLTVASMAAVHTQLVAELNLAASLDTLTGALTRGAFMDRSRALLKDLAPTNAPLAFLMMDLDHFKEINDRYGHAAGDSALIAVVEHLVSVCPDDALMGRLGGEEFVALIPHIEKAESLTLANELRLRVSQYPLMTHAGESFRVSMSIGLFVTHAYSGLTMESALASADGALYQAKVLGRDQVQVQA
jgi:diguanylate cyclase (GGDEF)-like protein